MRYRIISKIRNFDSNPIATSVKSIVVALSPYKTTLPTLFKQYQKAITEYIQNRKTGFTGTKEQWEEIEKELKKLKDA